MAAIFKIWNTYISPAANMGCDLGSNALRFNNAYIGGFIYALGGIDLTAQNIVTDTTTGTKIGTATSQKLGFFNVTPIIQPLATVDLGVVLSNLGLRAVGTAYPITTTGIVTLSELHVDDIQMETGDYLLCESGYFITM